ncbi:MAG: hypothetical protein ABI266_09520 [Ginsengibacter sp.]
MRAQRLSLIILCLLFVAKGFSQDQPKSLSNLRVKKISTKNNPAIIDANSIIPNTVIISGIAQNKYEVNYVNATITWKSRELPDSVLVTYRVFPFKLNAVTRHLNYDSIRYNFTTQKPFVIKGGELSSKVIDFGNIDYNGSLGRGITFGNNQDAVVNSVLNLQLSGYIGDSVQLTAAISDNNIPIQPQGNTQDIRDFDRIFLQAKKKGWQANFGDIDIRQSQNYFLRFYKRLQGASFQTDNKIGKDITNSLLASGAVAKGKFTRNIIAPLEGNQGPYKLYGANNEFYFAVLAGTEKVYINGQLLTRGEDQDYIIDYNTAEITFTVKRLITKNSRIQVEFEYSDRNFLSSMIYLNDEINFKKLKVSVAAYSNVDAKNSSINQTLSSEQKQFLSEIGNNIQNAKYPNAQIDTFSVNKILYKKVDSVYNGARDSVYIYSTNKDDTLYNLSFTNVGPGNGNYMPVNGDANGRVFQYLQPINGTKQGQWDPVILLITPKKQQIITLAAQYLLTKNSSIRGELAMSDYDINTFSSKDKGNDKGIAAKVQYGLKENVFQHFKKGISFQTDINYEYVQDNFKPLEVLRNVEFNRDWGLPFFAKPATENLLQSSFTLTDEKNNLIRYQFANYNRSDDYNGIRNSLENVMTLKGWNFNNKIFITSINGGMQKGNFIRPSVDINRIFPGLKNIRIGGGYLAETNRQFNKQADTLMPVSSGLVSWQLYLKSDESKPNRWGVNFFTRENKLPFQKKLLTTGKSNNINAIVELLKNEKHQFKLSTTYRVLNTIDPVFSKNQVDKTLLGRAEYAVNEWKGFVAGSVLYEVGAGQEPKREYTYVEVPAGQGYYTWIDYNKDGIPQLNEFEIAIYQDQKKWIRVFTPTNEFVKSNYVQFNYSLNLNPSSIISRSTSSRTLKFISRISSSSTLQINKKNLSAGVFELSPFSKKINDTSLITLYSFLSNTIYFNRRSSVWGIDLTHRLSTIKSLLNYGFETNTRRDVTLKGRWNVSKSIGTTLTNKYIKNQLQTPAFANRNYLVDGISFEPAVSYIYKSDFRVSLIYTYDNKKNKSGSGESALNNILTTEIRYNVLSSGIINGRISYNNISFNGMQNSTVGYILLDGLLPGKNYLWSVELTKKLAGNLELNLQYEGRKPGENKAIHTGRASIRAIF